VAAEVVYKDGTFSPARVEVKVGESVRFLNGSTRPVWPAANIHPTHQTYPGFDPKKPVAPGDSWVFTFDRAGYWRYHNHLNSEQVGLVVAQQPDPSVVRPSVTSVDPATLHFRKPGKISKSDAKTLFNDDRALQEFIRDFGPSNTVRVLAEQAPSLSVDCHQRAHHTGHLSYTLYGFTAFSVVGHDCQSGGFHGVTEMFIRDRGAASLATDVDQVCGSEPNAFHRHQCVHGVGHGVMAWTSYELIDALAICDELKDATARESCYSGVFMENVVGGLSGGMGHRSAFLSNDPHFPCNALDMKYVSGCYFYQTSRMVVLFKEDFKKVAHACNEAPAMARANCFQSMGRDIGGVSRGEPAKAIALCANATDGPDRRDCIEGAVQDWFWEPPGADSAIGFCKALTVADEKTRCYATIIPRARLILSDPVAVERFCANVEERFRSDCRLVKPISEIGKLGNWEIGDREQFRRDVSHDRWIVSGEIALCPQFQRADGAHPCPF
jgi:plastocyanin